MALVRKFETPTLTGDFETLVHTAVAERFVAEYKLYPDQLVVQDTTRLVLTLEKAMVGES
jgi:hypothetical protein